jgi:hypothetical protein
MRAPSLVFGIEFVSGAIHALTALNVRFFLPPPTGDKPASTIDKPVSFLGIGLLKKKAAARINRSMNDPITNLGRIVLMLNQEPAQNENNEDNF